MSRKLKDLDSKWGGVSAAAADDDTVAAAASSDGSVTLDDLDSKWGKPTGHEGASQYETKRTANLNTYVSPERAAAIQKIRDNAAQNKSQLQQAEGQDKAARYAAVNRYFEGDADARRLWKLERGYNANPNAAAARRAEAEALRRNMQPEQREAYNKAMKLYDSYGRAYSAGQRAKDVVGGSLKGAADSIGAFMEGMALGSSEESKRAQWEMRHAMDNGTVFDHDENGDLKVSDDYKKALDTYNKTKDDKVVLDESFSPALARNRADQAQVERGLAGTTGVTRKAGELAGSMAQNAPGMAAALIPGVGFGVSMGALGLQAAGNRADELSARDIDVREALARGAVSGAIEVGTEMVPIGEWVPEKIGRWVKQPVKNWVKIVKEGGESAAENLAKQAMGEATEEGTSYVLNYLADLAAKDPEAEFSLAELADNMAMGAASGAAYGIIGTGINRALGGSAQTNGNNGEGVVNQDTISETKNGQVAEGLPSSAAAAAPSPEGEGLGELPSSTAGNTAPAAAEEARNLSGEENIQKQAAEMARAALAEQEARRQEQAFTQPLIRQVQQETAEMAGGETEQGQQREAGLSSAAAEKPSPSEEGSEALRRIAAQRNMVAGGMTVDEAEQAYNARQAAQKNVGEVQKIAESGIYNDAMNAALVENYRGGSVDTYMQAMSGLYNAGRTGSLTFEQGVRAVAPAAAVVNNETALRAAYEAGRSTVTAAEPMAAPGVSGNPAITMRGTTPESTSTPLQALQLAAMKLGTNVTIAGELDDGNGNAVNGSYNAANNEISLSEKSVNSYQTALHETAHYIQQNNPEGWAEVKRAALAFYTEKVGMTEAQDKVFKAYENAYGTDTGLYDEVAADLLSGIMSTDDGVEQYCDYILTADQYTTPQKRTILQTLRDAIGQLIESIKNVLRGGDATLGAAEGRKLAERAENLQEAAGIVDEYLDALDAAKNNAREIGKQKNVQVEQKKTAQAEKAGGKKYSYAGTEAAQADYNDLHKAQQMELDGEDAEDIRKETGWFRGADYKWRFEIDDSKTVWHREGDYGLQLRDATYREYKDLMNKMLYGTLSGEQMARLQQLDREYKGVSDRKWKKLGDYLEAPELYRQYPDLQTLPVSFEDLGKNVNGTMSRLDGLLLSDRLRNADSDYLKRTVLHEVQHWIQNEEGFAGGANPEYWAKRLQQGDPIETKGMRDARGKMQALEERYPNIAEYAKEYANYESDEKLNALLERAAKDGISEDVLDDYYMAQWDAERADGAGSRTAEGLYYDTAGEQEARDTANRMRYTAEERKANKPFTGNGDTVFAVNGDSFSNVQPGKIKESATGERYLEQNSVPTDTDMALSEKKHPTEQQSVKQKDSLATNVGERTSSIKNMPQNGENVNKPVTEMSTEEAYAENERLKDAMKKLRDERSAWENSAAVEEIRAERDKVRGKYGRFSGQLKEWEANTPAWKEYTEQRAAYKERAAALNERQDAVAEVLRSAGADKATQQWQEKQAAQQVYDQKVKDSGKKAADYRRDLAVEHYGTTEDYARAAYLLPDGRMLDFTDGNAGEKRGLDHRNIQNVFGPAELGPDATQASYLNTFIREGNVRIMPEGPGVDISAEVKPTAAQYERIAEMADTLGVQNRKFSVDLSDADGKQIATRQYEGRVRGSDVVNDIKAFYRDGGMTVRSELEQFRYSRKSAAEQIVSEATEKEQLKKQLTAAETEKRELARKYTKARESADYWRQETQLSGGHLMDKKAVQKTASEFIDKYGSRYGKSQLAGELERAFSKISRDGASTEEALETLTNIARGVLKESTVKDTTLRDYYAPVRDWLKNTTFEIRKNSPEYGDLMSEYGDGADGSHSWANVRKNTFGRVNLKLVGENVTGNLDTAMMEMADNWPTIFDAEAAPVDNIRNALGVYEASQVQYHDTYGNDLDTAAALAGQELMDAYLETPTRETRADKAAAQLNQTRTALRAEQKAALAAQKAAYEVRVKALESDQSAQKAKLRAKWIETTRKAAQANNTKVAERLNRQAEGYKVQLMRMDTPDYKKMQKQLLNQRAAFETLNERRKDTILLDRARDSVQKNVKQLYKWLAKPNEAGHVQTRMEKAVYDLLGKIDPSTSARGTKSDIRWQETMKDIRQMAQQSLDADKGLTDADDYADFDPDLPNMISELIDDVGDIDLHKLNGRQTQQLADILTSMKTSILNANKMMADGRGKAVQTVAEGSILDMQSVKASQLKNRNALLGKAADTRVGDMTAQLLGLDMMDARRYFSSLGSVAENDVYKPIRDGFDKRVWKLDAAQEKFAEIKGDADISKWTGEKAERQTFKLADGNEIALTVGQRMEIYNLTQRQQAHEHLVKGGISIMEDGKKKKRVRLTPGDLADITSSLTNEQVKMARKMAAYLSATDGPAGWGNEVTQKLYGLNKFTESYYWPIKTDSNYTRTSDATAGDTPGLYAIKNQGFTKALQRKANNPLIINDAFDTWCDHVANMATYNAWAIPLSDAMKWYNYHGENEISTKEAIDGVYGENGKKFFQTLMQDINGVSAAPSQTGGARFAKTMVRNWKVAKVGANLRVAIQQPTAYTRAAAVISPKYLTAALAYDVGRMKQGMERAESNCGIAKWKSWGYFETNIGKSMKSVLTGERDTLDKVREISTIAAEYGDKLTWGTLWNACELEARDKGMKPGSQESLDYCAARLSEIVDKTQVVDSVLHRSQIMRSKDMLMQMATNFFAEPTKTYSMIAEAAVKLAHREEGARANMGRVLATYFVTAFGTAAAASFIDALRGGDDDDDKTFLQKWLGTPLDYVTTGKLPTDEEGKIELYGALWENFVDNINLLNNMPVVKDILSIAEGYDATRTDLEWVGDIVTAIGTLMDAYKGDPNGKITPYKAIYQTATAISDATGIPIASAVRDVKSGYDWITIFIKNPDPLHLNETIRDTGKKANSKLARGDVAGAQEVIDNRVAAKQAEGKTDSDIRGDIKSDITSYWKKIYFAATDEQRKELAKQIKSLTCLGKVLYEQKDLDNWVKDEKKKKEEKEKTEKEKANQKK